MFRFRELDCLVYVVVTGEIHPIQEKIDAINNILAPQTKKQVRFVIEMIWFYRKCIPHFAEGSAIPTTLF